MREVQIDGKTMTARANPLALLYYKQEFKSDFLGDLTKWRSVRSDPSTFDSVGFMQFTWALIKAGSSSPNDFPSFVAWVGSLESFDFEDTTLLTAVMEECADGFFRGGSAGRSK